MLGLVAKTFPEVLLEARLRGGAEDRAESEVALSVPWVAQSGGDQETTDQHNPGSKRETAQNRGTRVMGGWGVGGKGRQHRRLTQGPVPTRGGLGGS